MTVGKGLSFPDASTVIHCAIENKMSRADFREMLKIILEFDIDHKMWALLYKPSTVLNLTNLACLIRRTTKGIQLYTWHSTYNCSLMQNHFWTFKVAFAL